MNFDARNEPAATRLDVTDYDTVVYATDFDRSGVDMLDRDADRMSDDDSGYETDAVEHAERRSGRGTRTTVDIVVPVFNEEDQLAGAVERLLALTRNSENDVTVVIADNASTDSTPVIARHLADEHDRVRFERLALKGRGRALNKVWSESNADVVAYTDVDLATDVRLLDPMVAVLASGTADVAIASRLLKDSRVERGVKREVISRCYNRMLKGYLDVSYSDAQCGFKAMTRRAADAILPHVKDTNWFFDTELLTLAQWSGLRIHEFAADWTDDPDSSVNVTATALEDVKGMMRMRRDLRKNAVPLTRIAMLVGREPARPNLGAQLMHFVDVGILCTVTYSVGFMVLAQMMDVNLANFVALLGSAILNTAVNRRYTFGAQNPQNTVSHHVKGLAVYGLCWALTSGAIALAAGMSSWIVLVAVTLANIGATLLRFALQKIWVFADTQRSGRRVAGGARR